MGGATSHYIFPLTAGSCMAQVMPQRLPRNSIQIVLPLFSLSSRSTEPVVFKTKFFEWDDVLAVDFTGRGKVYECVHAGGGVGGTNLRECARTLDYIRCQGHSIGVFSNVQ